MINRLGKRKAQNLMDKMRLMDIPNMASLQKDDKYSIYWYLFKEDLDRMDYDTLSLILLDKVKVGKDKYEGYLKDKEA